METSSVSLQIHSLTSHPKRGQVVDDCHCNEWISSETDTVTDIYGNKQRLDGLQKDPKAYLRYNEDAEIVGSRVFRT